MSYICTYIYSGVGYIGLDTGTMDNKKWLNLISHLGCKSITRVRYSIITSHDIHMISLVSDDIISYKSTLHSNDIKYRTTTGSVNY